jgi:ATP-dependent RNA helicase DDX49/DBP8
MSSPHISDQESYSNQESNEPVSISHVAVDQNESRKRRRLSPAASEEPFDSHPSLPISSLSRINARKTGLPSKASSRPDSIASTLISQEKISFASLNVAPWLVSSLAAMEIKRPTGIQKGCIPEILNGRDCIGGSRTGSGKTVAFAVPILQKWAEDPVGIFAVVLTPTR